MGNAAKQKISKFSLYGFFCYLFVFIIFLQPLSAIYKQRNAFLSRGYSVQYEFLKKLYSDSQYVKKNNPGIIPDQALEAYIAGAFLRGVNPILVIHDQPPLGRYMLSLSIFLFDNVSTIMLVFYLFSGVGVLLVSRLILKNTMLSLVPLAVFINEPLFINKFYNSPLLEPIQLPFIIFSLYFFIKGVVTKKYIKWFILTAIMLGFVISIRFFILGAVLISAMILYLLLKKRVDKRFIVFLLTLPFAIIILLISYTRTIQLGSSFLHIFGIQKYIYSYHSAQLSLPFSFWDLIMFNRWHTWWGDRAITSDLQWIIFWPISMIFTLTYFLIGILRKILISEPERILIIWVIMYSLFLSLGENSTRYFPPLLPFIYILATSFFVKIIFKFKSKMFI